MTEGTAINNLETSVGGNVSAVLRISD